MEKNYGLIMPFVDESESFVHGFECGIIWEKIKSSERLYEHLFHVENSAQVQMMCDAFEVKCL